MAARRIDTLLTKVAANKHVQRFAAFKPVADVIGKISKADIGANVAITNLSGLMTVNFIPPYQSHHSFDLYRSIFHHHQVTVFGKTI